MEKHWRKWRKSLFSVLLVILLAGCQPVSGIDFNQLFLNEMDIVSQEESGTTELKIDWNEKYIENNENRQFAALAKLVSQVTLDIEKSQTDADGRAVMEGALTLGDKPPVGFSLHADEASMYLDVDGFSQPLYIDLNEMTDGNWAQMRVSLKASDEVFRTLMKEAAAYFVRNLPNPPTLQVKQDVAEVGGQSLTLTKVHAEMKGSQLGEWLIQFVDALVQDPEGLRAGLETLAKMSAELSRLETELPVGEMGESEGLTMTEAEMEEFVEEGFQGLYSFLQEAQSRLAEFKDSDQWLMIFDDGVVLKMDLWLDGKLNIRKSDVELTVAPAVLKLPFSPVHSVTLRSQSERWNVNGDVQVSPVSAPEAAMGPENLMDMDSHKFLRMLEGDSVLYDLLKNDLGIDDSSFKLSPYNFYGTAPFAAEDGTLFVPVRDAVENFGIDIEYVHETRQIRFYDGGTQQEIVLYIGTPDAVVNGNAVQLSKSLQLINNYTYMAAEDLFNLLKASYTYETDEWDDLWVQVERDL